MKNILIGICDHSDYDTKTLVQYLKNIETTLDTHFSVHTYSNGIDLLNAYRPIYDILFLNIPMLDIDAETVISKIRQKDALVHIVLVSGSCEFLRLGFRYNAANYFDKPLRYSMVSNELNKFLSDEQILQRPYLWLSTQHGEYKLYHHKLRFIETCDRQLKLHYENELFFYNGKLCDLEEQLTTLNFFRCNNSYIVNTNYIEKIEKDLSRYTIHLVTSEKIPLSRNKKNILKELLFSLDS